jgi:hypothetical protein
MNFRGSKKQIVMWHNRWKICKKNCAKVKSLENKSPRHDSEKQYSLVYRAKSQWVQCQHCCQHGALAGLKTFQASIVKTKCWLYM